MLGLRALVSREIIGSQGGKYLPTSVMPVGFVSHAKLLPQVVALVHHGGAGTTHSAALMGVPQVVVPHLLDQYYWAHRVQQLGLGPEPIPFSRLNARNLAASIKACLLDNHLQERTLHLSIKLATDGTRIAAEHLLAMAR